MAEEAPTPPTRPLYDVWLRPRRVFREMAAAPITYVDYLLGAAQGIVSWLALSRAQSAGAGAGVADILGRALIAGPVAGVLGLHLMTAVYARLGRRMGGVASRSQVFHVLAYSGVPLVLSLGIWLIAALLAGNATFIETPHADLEGFVLLLLRMQFLSHLLLIGWSLLLQIMGFSEIQRLGLRRAFSIWIFGQLLVALAILFLWILISSLGLGAPPPA